MTHHVKIKGDEGRMAEDERKVNKKEKKSEIRNWKGRKEKIGKGHRR